MAEIAGVDPRSIKAWSLRSTRLRDGRATTSRSSMANPPLRDCPPRKRRRVPPNPNRCHGQPSRRTGAPPGVAAAGIVLDSIHCGRAACASSQRWPWNAQIRNGEV